MATHSPSVVMATLRKLVSVLFFYVGLCNVIEPMRNVRFISQYFSFSSPPQFRKRVNVSFTSTVHTIIIYFCLEFESSDRHVIVVCRAWLSVGEALWEVDGVAGLRLSSHELFEIILLQCFRPDSRSTLYFGTIVVVWQGWRGNLSHNIIKLSSKATKLVDWEISNSIILVVQTVLKETLQNAMLSWTSVCSRHQCSGHSLVRQAMQRSVVFCSEGEVCEYVITDNWYAGRVGGTREETMIEWGKGTNERKEIGKENKNEEGMKGQIQILHTHIHTHTLTHIHTHTHISISIYIYIYIMGKFSCKSERLRDNNLMHKFVCGFYGNKWTTFNADWIDWAAHRVL